MKIALALVAVLGASSASAATYYVGENLQTQNMINLGYSGTPVKEQGARSGSFVNALELKAAYNPIEEAHLRGGLPFYFATKDLTGTSRSALGNISLGGGYAWTAMSDDKAWTYGLAFTGDVFFPTSRKLEGGAMATINPTTDFFKYSPKTTSATPTIGGWLSSDMITAKLNVGYGYSYVQGTGVTDHNRNTFTTQTALTWHALPNLQGNLEYNGIIFDNETKTGLGILGSTATKKWRHAVVPSISGNYDNVQAALYASVPLDKSTRDITNVAFGLNAGYLF